MPALTRHWFGKRSFSTMSCAQATVTPKSGIMSVIIQFAPGWFHRPMTGLIRVNARSFNFSAVRVSIPTGWNLRTLGRILGVLHQQTAQERCKADNIYRCGLQKRYKDKQHNTQSRQPVFHTPFRITCRRVPAKHGFERISGVNRQSIRAFASAVGNLFLTIMRGNGFEGHIRSARVKTPPRPFDFYAARP